MQQLIHQFWNANRRIFLDMMSTACLDAQIGRIGVDYLDIRSMWSILQ